MCWFLMNALSVFEAASFQSNRLTLNYLTSQLIKGRVIFKGPKSTN